MDRVPLVMGYIYKRYSATWTVCKVTKIIQKLDPIYCMFFSLVHKQEFHLSAYSCTSLPQESVTSQLPSVWGKMKQQQSLHFYRTTLLSIQQQKIY